MVALTPNEVLALADFGESETLTRREISSRLGSAISDRQVRRALEELRDRGLVVSPGRGRSGRWKHAGS